MCPWSPSLLRRRPSFALPSWLPPPASSGVHLTPALLFFQSQWLTVRDAGSILRVIFDKLNRRCCPKKTDGQTQWLKSWVRLWELLLNVISHPDWISELIVTLILWIQNGIEINVTVFCTSNLLQGHNLKLIWLNFEGNVTGQFCISECAHRRTTLSIS